LARLKGHEDAIYSLPPKLIDALQEVSKQRAVPKVFTPEEEIFERELARTGNGFFLGESFVYPPFPILPEIAETEPERQAMKQQLANDSKIKELMKEEMASSGRSDAEIDQYFSRGESIRRLVEERQAAYAGWLVSNPDLRDSVCAFHNRWAARIDSLGVLPALPRSLYGHALQEAPNVDPVFFFEYSMLCRFWSIDRLATWDLPVPMDAQLTDAAPYDLNQVDPAGVVLFVPWYLLRDKRLTLEGLASTQRTYTSPNHLAKWLNRQPKNFGIKRYGIMLQLYMCLELALNRRYPDQLLNKLELFDDAFGLYVNRSSSDSRNPDSGAENIRKLRQMMVRLLNKPTSFE
jgi:hypothetical protein